MLCEARSLARATAHYVVNAPIVKRSLSPGQDLFLHPPSGSWVVVPSGVAPAVEAILRLAEADALDDVPDSDIGVIARKLHAAGLLAQHGRSAWSGRAVETRNTKVNTLILKMVGYCNIACTYCYDFSSASYKSRLTVEQGCKAVDGALARAGNRLNVLFHGGEPLLAFEAIRAIAAHAKAAAAARNIEILLSIQTNGTRFDDATVPFLIENEFSVGISLDGPAEINDAHRITFGGAGTHDRIVTLLERYPELLKRLGVLTTVTRRNCAELLPIARAFRDMGIQCWDVTVFQAAGRGSLQEDKFAPDTDILIGSYFALMDAIENGEMDTIEIRPILHYLRNLLSFDRRNMCLRDACGAGRDLVSVSADGKVEACDCISNPDLSIGHLDQGGIEVALASPTAERIRGRTTAKLEPCSSCDWRTVCGGTCLAKAGEVSVVDAAECKMSMAIFPELLRRLGRSPALARYAERFA